MREAGSRICLILGGSRNYTDICSAQYIFGSLMHCVLCGRRVLSVLRLKK